MKRYLLDKILDVDTLYRTENDKAFVINEIGTDSDSLATLKIGGSPVLESFTKIADVHKTGSNNNGLEPLGDNYVVVPPGKPFSFLGATDSKLRIKGSIEIIEPGETLPAGLMARYTEQAKKYKSYQTASTSPSGGTTASAGEETDVLTFTCPSGEKWTFAELYMAEQINTDDTVDDRFHSRIYVDDYPLDLIEDKMGPKGICCGSAPYPSRDVRNKVPFSLETMPLELTPGRTLRISIINTGANYAPSGAPTINYYIALVGIKEYA